MRFAYNLNAARDRVTANPHALNHLMYTLLSGVADGLSGEHAFIGIGTRDVERNGVPHLHVEIRDGGGLATFAGTGTVHDQRILEEQNRTAEEFADWVFLAERIDADLRILREGDVVTRAELFLPLNADKDEAARETEKGRLVWVVEDNDREYETLRHMLSEAGLHPYRLTSAAALREHYPVAPAAPELVILKYHLPDQRGATLRTWLYEQDSDLPVILISSFSATHPGIATANNLPSTLYLQKPFDTQALLDMLRMTLDDTLAG